MRNLKRALSLALASVMLMGMMVVGTSAASFADVDSKDNVEAIEVVKALEIMVGDENGNFNPDKKVTRNEMAVVIAKLLNLKVEDFAGSASFTDVPAWAEPYVSACYAEGIVAGYDATTFGGNDGVTAAQAGLMVMKTLGYFAFQSDYEDDWQMATVKQASKIDLYDGIDTGVTATLTRNEVAQLVLNALESVVVEGEQDGNTTNITAGDVSITVTGKTTYENVIDTNNYNYDVKGTNDAKDLYLIEKLYEDRFEKDTEGTTDLGLPAVEWQDTEKKTDKVFVTVADEADEVLVAAEEITAEDLYKDEIDEDFDETMTEVTANAGDVVYYYEQKGGDIDAYVVSYTLAKVTKIDKDMTKAELKEGYSFEVTLDGKTKIYDTDFADFDYAKNDYILVVMNEAKDEVLASELAETVEGKITSLKSGKYYIDGEGYKNLSDTKLDVQDEISAILNKAGQIIKVTEQNADAKSDDVAYIYNVKANEGSANADGVDTDGSYTAYVVLADGTKASYVIEDDSVATIIGEEFKAQVVAYSINKDGEFVVEASDLTVYETETTLNVDNKSVTNGSDKVYANSATEFVFASWNTKGTKLTATTATGIKNVDITANIFVVYDADDDEALYVFVEAKDEGVESDAMYAVMMDKSTEYSYTKDEDGNTYYTYNVVVDGEETTLTFEEAAGISRGTIFAFVMDGEYAVVSDEDTAKLANDTVAYVGEGFIEFKTAEGEFTVADDAELYTVTEVKNAKGTTTGYEVAEADELAKDDVIKFIANKDNEITLAFIVEVDD